MRGVGARLGQATVEFSIAFPIVLAGILALVQLALYTVESDSAKNAVSVGALVAASAAPGKPGTSALGAVDAAVRQKLEHALFGARIEHRDPVNGSCPALGRDDPVGVVYVCAAPLDGGHAAEVCVRGWVPALVPPTFGLPSARAGALSVDVRSYVRTLVFSA